MVSRFPTYLINNTDYQLIINLDKLTYAGNPDNLINLENDPRYEFINDDICNKDCIKKIFHLCFLHFIQQSFVQRGH